MTRFCRSFRGTCEACVAAQAQSDKLLAILNTLTDEDRDSSLRRDEEDERTFSLDQKGRP